MASLLLYDNDLMSEEEAHKELEEARSKSYEAYIEEC